jgi:hypothetical protein
VSDAKAKFKVYAIAEFNWQYDDQNHYTPEGDPSHPIRAYLSEQRAQDDCLIRNMVSFRGRDLGDYSNDGASAYIEGSEEDFVTWANKELGTKWAVNDHVFVVPKDLPDNKLILLMAKFSLRFFEVLQLDFDPDTSAVPEPPKPEPVPEPPKAEEPKLEAERTIFLED